MATCDITGAPRGSGLKLAKQVTAFPETPVSKIFAITHGSSSLLEEINSSPPTRVVNIVFKDLCIEEVVLYDVNEALKPADPIDVHVNNGAPGKHSPEGMHSVTVAGVREVLEANLVPARVMTAAYLPFLTQ